MWRSRLRVVGCEERAGIRLRTYGGLQQSTGFHKLHLEYLSMSHVEREEQYTCCDSRRFAQKLKQEGTIQCTPNSSAPPFALRFGRNGEEVGLNTAIEGRLAVIAQPQRSRRAKRQTGTGGPQEMTCENDDEEEDGSIKGVAACDIVCVYEAVNDRVEKSRDRVVSANTAKELSRALWRPTSFTSSSPHSSVPPWPPSSLRVTVLGPL